MDDIYIYIYVIDCKNNFTEICCPELLRLSGYIHFTTRILNVDSYDISVSTMCIYRDYWVLTTPTCTWWNRPEEDLSSVKLELLSTHSHDPC